MQRGSDERQYNSPGIDFPIASIMRSKHGTYPEYHTSLDNFDLVTAKGLAGGFKIVQKAILILMNSNLQDTQPKRKKNCKKNLFFPKNLVLCEPQMSKRRLYPFLSTKHHHQHTKNLMNFLQYADGSNDLRNISRIIKVPLSKTNKIFKILLNKKLITTN